MKSKLIEKKHLITFILTEESFRIYMINRLSVLLAFLFLFFLII